MENYSLTWGSNHPGLLVYLLDLSGSMGDNDNEKLKKLLDVLYDVCNYMVLRKCKKGNDLLERVKIIIVGYNGRFVDYKLQEPRILFEGGVKKMDKFLSDMESEYMFDINDDVNGVKPLSLTFTADAFLFVKKLIQKHLDENQGRSIPAPIVMHITDGHPEEAIVSPEKPKGERIPQDVCIEHAKQAARELTSLRGSDGNVLLFNIHISGSSSENECLLFPSKRPEKDAGQQFLFDISSCIAPPHIKTGMSFGYDLTTKSRFMSSNVTDKHELLRIIEFQSSVSMDNAGGETLQ